MKRNLIYIPEYTRWDNMFVFIGTALEKDMLKIVKDQLTKDLVSETPSLLAKWTPSENTSSAETCALATRIRKYLGLSSKQYRKTLSALRKKINVLEKLMSDRRWDEIEFDKIPSKAGIKYRKAFERHDIDRKENNPEVQSYADFAKSKDTKVNTKTLFPYECVSEAMKLMGYGGGWYSRHNEIDLNNTERLMINKYWNNLENYFKDASFNGMAVVDTSGSMCRSSADAPINVAISLGLYCAEKAKGPYHGHFITFSSNPTFVETEGVDFCDKVQRMSKAEWGGSTNIEAAFDLILDVALQNKLSQDEIPENLIIISDQEYDACATFGAASYDRWGRHNKAPTKTLFEQIEAKWNSYGYILPKLVFWNVDARQNNIAMTVKDGVSFVSGMSPSIFQQIMSGKTAADLMYEVLNQARYSIIQ